MNNKYVNRSKISEAKFRELVRFFSIDLTVTQIAELTGLNRNTINRYLTEFRKKSPGIPRLHLPRGYAKPQESNHLIQTTVSSQSGRRMKRFIRMLL